MTKRLNSWSKACHHTLHTRLPIDMSCRVSGETSEGFTWQKIELNKKLKRDSVHKQIMTTKRKLEDNENFSADEAMRYAIKKRKYLIQDVTGTLSDCELEPDYHDTDNVDNDSDNDENDDGAV